jgi:CRISPR-associated protein Cas1
MLPDLTPIPIKERRSILFVERCHVDVRDGAFVMIDKDSVRTHVPVGGTACLLLEPGVRLSHRAAALAAKVGTLLVWVGEGGVRLYSAGQPGGARSDRLLYQAKLALDESARLKVVRKMFELRFGEEPPSRRSVEQLRGIEGARVKKTYQLLADKYGVVWKRRRYDQQEWDKADLPNRCLSAATACLYGVTEAAVLAAACPATTTGSASSTSSPTCPTTTSWTLFKNSVKSKRMDTRFYFFEGFLAMPNHPPHRRFLRWKFHRSFLAG